MSTKPKKQPDGSPCRERVEKEGRKATPYRDVCLMASRRRFKSRRDLKTPAVEMGHYQHAQSRSIADGVGTLTLMIQINVKGIGVVIHHLIPKLSTILTFAMVNEDQVE